MTVGATEGIQDISTDDPMRRRLVLNQVMDVLIARLNVAQPLPVSPETAQ